MSVSTFTLEDDSIVGPSPLIDEIPRAGLEVDRNDPPPTLVFADEALSATLPVEATLSPVASAWLALRRGRSPAARPEFHGDAGPVRSAVYAVTAIDRFLQCPFKYFAHTVLRLPEDVEDEPTMSPRAEGEFVHGVLRAFFETWQSSGLGTITAELLPEARSRFAAVAERALAGLPASEAAVQRMRLLGAVGAPGLGENRPRCGSRTPGGRSRAAARVRAGRRVHDLRGRRDPDQFDCAGRRTASTCWTRGAFA